MKKNLFILFIIIIIILTGIVFFIFYKKTDNKKIIKENTEEQIEKTLIDPSSLTWKKISEKAIWPARDSHAVVVFKDKIWLMGGLDGTKRLISPGNVDYGSSLYFSDVWSSEDGTNWELATNNAPWGKRRSMQVVNFKNKMWLMGGWGPEEGYKNDVWSSEDGINWEKEVKSAEWPAREGHQLVVFKDKIWLMGGVKYTGQKLFNDVWYSEDGVSWKESTRNAGWVPRWDFSSTVFKDKIWILGGMAFKDKIFNDVWYSEDGISWEKTKEDFGNILRQGSTIIDYRDKMWALGRLDISLYGGGVNDVWYSEDGINWEKTKEDPVWTGREDTGVVVFKDKIWILGGMDKNWEWKNDIWQSISNIDIKN